METNEILALFDAQERINSKHPSYRYEKTAEIVRHVSLEPSRLSFISYSDLTATNADRVIQEQVAWYKNEIDGYGFEWKTFDHDAPPDLKQRLLEYGFEADEPEALLVLDLEDCPQVYLQPVTADVRRITDVERLEEVTAVQSKVYDAEFTWLEKELRENMTAQPDFWSIYIAYVDDTPACAAWISYPQDSQFAGLWGGATLLEYRKMGLYTAVVAARAQEAIERGYRFLTVDASDMSSPILQKRGFKLLTYTTPFTWKSKPIQS